MKPIVGANHRATRLEITLPVDETGEYAFDDTGNPIKNKVPAVVLAPRYDCLTRDEYKQLSKDLQDVADKKDDEGNPLSPYDRVYEEVMAVLHRFNTEEQLAAVGKLRTFELMQIAERVQEGNSMSLGELLASTGSSKSTAGRSKQTSSPISE